MSALPAGVTVYETDDERVLIHAELFPIACFGWTVHAVDVDGVQSRHSVPEGRMDQFAADWCGRVLGPAVKA